MLSLKIDRNGGIAMNERPDKLVQELVKKVITLAQIGVAQAITNSAGINIDDDAVSSLTEEAEALMKKIVLRMKVVDGDV